MVIRFRWRNRAAFATSRRNNSTSRRSRTSVSTFNMTGRPVSRSEARNNLTRVPLPISAWTSYFPMRAGIPLAGTAGVAGARTLLPSTRGAFPLHRLAV